MKIKQSLMLLMLITFICSCDNNQDHESQSKVEIELVGPVNQVEISKTIQEYNQELLLQKIQADSVYDYRATAPFFFLKVSNKSKDIISLGNLGNAYFIYPTSMEYKGNGRKGISMNSAQPPIRVDMAAGESRILLTRLYDVDTILVAYPYRMKSAEDGVGVFRQKYKMHQDYLEKLSD